MTKKYGKFILKLFILSLIAGLTAYLLDLAVPEGIITNVYPYLILLFLIISAMVHYVLLRISELNPRKFVGYFMLATTLKLLIYLVVVFIYVLLVKSGILQFILAFFILYIIYTVFEVVAILSQTKAQVSNK
jgi:hypothetical protein